MVKLKSCTRCGTCCPDYRAECNECFNTRFREVRDEDLFVSAVKEYRESDHAPVVHHETPSDALRAILSALSDARFFFRDKNLRDKNLGATILELLREADAYIVCVEISFAVRLCLGGDGFFFLLPGESRLSLKDLSVAVALICTSAEYSDWYDIHCAEVLRGNGVCKFITHLARPIAYSAYEKYPQV